MTQPMLPSNHFIIMCSNGCGRLSYLPAVILQYNQSLQVAHHNCLWEGQRLAVAKLEVKLLPTEIGKPLIQTLQMKGSCMAALINTHYTLLTTWHMLGHLCNIVFAIMKVAAIMFLYT